MSGFVSPLPVSEILIWLFWDAGLANARVLPAPLWQCEDISMKSSRFALKLRPAFACVAITFFLAVCAQAQTLTTLANFNGKNGQRPMYGPLVQATNGSFFGVAWGGEHGRGEVYELNMAGRLGVIYSFCALADCSDGGDPEAAPVVGDDGNLYGTTNSGGNPANNSGTIFKMTIGGKLTTLYTFCPGAFCTDGQFPVGLTQARSGNFYGAATNGGANGDGTIFEITKSGAFRVLHDFCSQQDCADGSWPEAAPIQASDGNFYGTTFEGGAYGFGVVYELTLEGRYSALYSFCSTQSCPDGAYPGGQLVEDASGNFFGTTSWGGSYGLGTVFEITASKDLRTIVSFDSTDGAYPGSALAPANDGNFYGVADGGGAFGGGTIFEISSEGEISTLYNFCAPSGCTKASPNAPVQPLFQGTDGNLYGTTVVGGSGTDGTVFSFSTGLGPLVETIPMAAQVGAHVIILGNNLTGSTAVAFNGTAAAFTVVSATEITTTVPSGATTGTVSVAMPSGTLYSNPQFVVME